MRLHVKTAWSVVALAALMSLPLAAGAASMTLKSPISNSTTASPVICGVSADARISIPWNPEVPQFLASRDPRGPYGEAGIAVTLDERGNVVETHVFESSGNALLDREALIAAKLSQYLPERNLCASRGGSYIVLVDFD